MSKKKKRRIEDIRQVRIGWKDYAIKFLYPRLYERIGEIRYQDAEIHIDPDLSELDRREVLLHEAFHGMLYAAGKDSGHSEKYIRILTRGLLQLFRDNPELARILASPID